METHGCQISGKARRCGDVAMWRRGDVAMWRCGDVAMWRRGGLSRLTLNPQGSISYQPQWASSRWIVFRRLVKLIGLGSKASQPICNARFRSSSMA